MKEKFNCIIMGAAGRDFHDFQTFFLRNPQFHVCAFTATQIPFIASRSFPQSLTGSVYEADIPIFLEDELPELIRRFNIDFVFLAYSDLPHLEVMHKASLVQSCGASFTLLGPKQTQLKSTKPVVSVTAVRTGAGKSPLTQLLAKSLNVSGQRVGVIRHPMPYGDLKRQLVEKFSTFDDLDRYSCTVEEREEYEPYIEMKLPIFAGVDYAAILSEAQKEVDVILWDGGNNDYPFIQPDFSIVVADALRAGHEVEYYPGETNLRTADAVVINKVGQAEAEDLQLIYQHVEQLNPSAEVIESDLEIIVNKPEMIKGKSVLVVEDGPTVTHGGMAYGAGFLAARIYKSAKIIDPRPYAIGTIADAFRNYPHLTEVLPALGYSQSQRDELAGTINASGADVVIDASPAGLNRILDLNVSVIRVRYQFQQLSGTPIEQLVQIALSK
jgi:predicted GTPase